MPTRKTASRAPRQKRVKQGHKLVWLTLIIIAIPVVIVGYVLLTSLDEQSDPVVGTRFSRGDLDPKIVNQDIKNLQAQLGSIEGVESATVNLKSATLRLHLNTADDLGREGVENVLHQARDIANGILPFETYFTNTEDGKSYDIEIDSYNFIPEDSQDGWVYFKLTKTGAGQEVIDEITAAKNPDLVQQITRQEAATDQPEEGELNPEVEEGQEQYW